MKCKKILLLLSIFLGLAVLPGKCQTFSVYNLERLVNNHPLMKNYNPETKRFKDTPSEIKSVEVLEKQIASVSAEIIKLEALRAKMLNDSFSSQSFDENSLWKSIRTISFKENKLKNQLAGFENLLDTDGIPPIETLLEVVRGIAHDVLNEIHQKSSEDEICLNKFPRFYQSPPDFRSNPFKKFFVLPDNKELLLEYLRYSKSISLLFPKSVEPILHEERKP
jgi:hypothetical protein